MKKQIIADGFDSFVKTIIEAANDGWSKEGEAIAVGNLYITNVSKGEAVSAEGWTQLNTTEE